MHIPNSSHRSHLRHRHHGACRRRHLRAHPQRSGIAHRSPSPPAPATSTHARAPTIRSTSSATSTPTTAGSAEAAPTHASSRSSTTRRFMQSGNDDHASARRHNDDLFRNISIDYDITLPKSSAHQRHFRLRRRRHSGRRLQPQGPERLRQRPRPWHSQDPPLSAPAPATLSSSRPLPAMSKRRPAAATSPSTASLEPSRPAPAPATLKSPASPSSDWKLSTGSGNIHLAVGSGARFNLDADTGSGTINVQQPITMQGSLNNITSTASSTAAAPPSTPIPAPADIQIR